jgi:hypothetical protein
VRGVDGTELGAVRDIYRVGETEVYVVDGGSFGSFDVPAVRAFVRVFAPRRGEIVVDAEALDLRAPRSRAPDPERPKAPRRRSRSKAVATDLSPADAAADAPAVPDAPVASPDPPEPPESGAPPA